MDKKEQDRLYELVGRKIREIRTISDMSQEGLADELGLSRTSVVNIEKGRQTPSIHLLIDISRIFNVSLEYFIDSKYWKTDEAITFNSVKSRIKNSTTTKSDQDKILNFFKRI